MPYDGIARYMKAFLCTAPRANHLAIPNSKVWINNLQRGLEALNVDVLLPTFDTHRQMMECMGNVNSVGPNEARTRYSELLLKDVENAHRDVGLDLVVAYIWSAHILPEVIRNIKRLGIPTVLFYCNAAHQFHQVEEIAPAFDFCMVPERQALPKYRAIGANPVHIQMAADPVMYQPSVTQVIYDATFVGQMYLNRPDYVAFLAWHGIDIHVWGPGWQQAAEWHRAHLSYQRRLRRAIGDAKRFVQRRLNILPTWYPLPIRRCGGILTDEAMVRIPSQSLLSLNFSEVRDDRTHEIKRHIRLRDFEVPMSGGLLVTGLQDELMEYYEIGREIVCYNSKEELLDLCRYYAYHRNEAETIRRAGHLRARRDHTWANRFRQLFATMHLSL